MIKDVYLWFSIAAIASGTETIIISFSNNMTFVLISGIIFFSIAFASFGYAILLMIKKRKNKEVIEKGINCDKTNLTNK